MMIVGLGGLSESGKSYSGSYLAQKYAIPRVKIIKYMKHYMSVYFNNEIDVSDFHDYLYQNPNGFTDFFHDKMISDLMTTYSEYPFIVIESLRNEYFGTFLKKRLGEKFIVIYLEAEFEDRVKRESIKTGIDASKLVKQVYEKDIDKISQGALSYKDLADYVIHNNQSIEQLNDALDHIALLIVKEQE